MGLVEMVVVASALRDGCGSLNVHGVKNCG